MGNNENNQKVANMKNCILLDLQSKVDIFEKSIAEQCSENI